MYKTYFMRDSASQDWLRGRPFIDTFLVGAVLVSSLVCVVSFILIWGWM